MAESKSGTSRAERNTTLRRRAAAASMGVLLGAFAIVAASAQQTAHQAGSANTPVVTAASIAGSTDTGSTGAGSTDTGSTAISAIAATQPVAASHASTRQS